jgi:ATP-binding cassette subfamily C protein LapB
MKKSSATISQKLLQTLLLYAKEHGQEISAHAITATLPKDPSTGTIDLLSTHQSTPLFIKAAQKAGFKATLIKKDLHQIDNLHLPIIIVLNEGAAILEAIEGDRAKITLANEPEPIQKWIDLERLKKHYTGYAFFLKKEPKDEDPTTFARRFRHMHWFWDTIKLSWPIYKDVLIASFLINLFVLATPLFTMNVYDRVIPNNALETLYVFAAGVITVYILDTFIKFTRAKLLEIAAKKSDVIMSSIIFEKVLDLKMEAFPRSVGAFASNIRDFDAIRNFLTSATISLLIDLPFSLLYLAVIYYIGGPLVLVPLGMMLLILLYALFIRKPLYNAIKSTHEASARKNAILVEALQNIETIKTQGLGGILQWRWEESVGEMASKSLRSKLLAASVPTITGFFVQLTTVLIIIAGVHMIKDIELTMGGLIGVVILASRTVAPMGQIAALLANFSDAKSAYDVIERIISQPSEHLERHNFIDKPTLKGKIEFRDVTFSYPDTQVPALKNVSFTINPGERVAIIGRIGSGKSTIEKLILKLYEPQSGSILVDDIDISQYDPATLRQNIAYVPQDVSLFRGTIKQNILFRKPEASDEELLEAAKLSGVEEFVKRHPLGFNMPIGERGEGLSGGQRQSVAIARAIISKAPITLLDEPTANLDQTSERHFLKNFNKIFGNNTIIIITQKPTLLPFVDRIIVMNEGRVYLDGPRDKVLAALKGGKNGQQQK